MATEQHLHEPEQMEILVNDRLVILRQRNASAQHIKEVAINQGVHIQLGYQLWEELEDGGVRAVPEQHEVSLRRNHHFTATPHEVEHKTFTLLVNEMPVKMEGHSATGGEIKAAAISQGVLIRQNFVLEEELANGTSRIVGDHDSIELREHLRFTAIAPDDNS